MLVGQFGRVVMFMAINTTEYPEIARGSMAVDAIVPFASVFSSENGKKPSIMVKAVVFVSRWMAGQTRRIFINITVNPSVPSIRFAPAVAIGACKFGIVGRIIVAIGALGPFAFMLAAVDREQRIVLSIFCGHPAHICGVAISAANREIRLLMVGV